MEEQDGGVGLTAAVSAELSEFRPRETVRKQTVGQGHGRCLRRWRLHLRWLPLTGEEAEHLFCSSQGAG